MFDTPILKKTHFPLSQDNQTMENIAQDMNTFIEKKLNINVGWEEDEVNGWITFLGYYGMREFNLTISYHDTLNQIQKEVHDYCREWLK